MVQKPDNTKTVYGKLSREDHPPGFCCCPACKRCSLQKLRASGCEEKNDKELEYKPVVKAKHTGAVRDVAAGPQSTYTHQQHLRLHVATLPVHCSCISLPCGDREQIAATSFSAH